MSEYDNSNTACIYSLDDTTKLVGSGKWDDHGFAKRIVLVKQTYPDGKEHRELYAKIGRLYTNDNKTENAPNFSGPITTDKGEMRVACWEKDTSQGRVLSMKIEERKQYMSPEQALEETAKFTDRRVDADDDDVVPF